MDTIAYFITSHGFGHATRSVAVMTALLKRAPNVRFEIFTTSPPWLFGELQQRHYKYHQRDVDVGMVQSSPLVEDPDATCHKLDRWLPLDPESVDAMAARLNSLQCQLVISDISPLGLVAGKRAKVPTLLVENFTWDWIYQAYCQSTPQLRPHIDYLEHVFDQADHRIQTQPVCQPVAGAIQVPPVSRCSRTDPELIRKRLNLPEDASMVLISMGGILDRFDFLKHLPNDLGAYLVIPGTQQGAPSPHRQVIQLPVHSDIYHPDLVQAADAIIGKAGYSTVAEAYQSGTPYGFILRTAFPESAVLNTFLKFNLPSHIIETDAYQSGEWIHALPELLSMPRIPGSSENGAQIVAAYIQDTFL